MKTIILVVLTVLLAANFSSVKLATAAEKAVKKMKKSDVIVAPTAEEEKAAAEAAKQFVKLGYCAEGETVYHREVWNATTSSGNILADALLNASTKETFIIVFEGVVKGALGKKVEVYLQDYTINQTRGGGILQPVTYANEAVIGYADKKLGRSHFYDKSRCDD